MTIRTENLPEHKVKLATLTDAHALRRRLISRGVRPSVASSIVMWASVEQSGGDTDTYDSLKSSYRTVLRELLEEDGTPCPPLTSGPKRSTRVRTRIPGLRKRFADSGASAGRLLAA